MHIHSPCSIYIIQNILLQPTFSSLGLEQADKTAVLQKTGPCPKWYTRWRTRDFALKGNFLYYYKPNTKVTIHCDLYVHVERDNPSYRDFYFFFLDRKLVTVLYLVQFTSEEQLQIKLLKNILSQLLHLYQEELVGMMMKHQCSILNLVVTQKQLK